MMKQIEDLRVGALPLPEAAVDLRRQLRDARHTPRWRAILAGSVVVALVAALNAAWMLLSVRPRIERAEAATELALATSESLRGELALVGLQNEELQEIVEYSAQYRIPADLAEAIRTIALSEDLEPDLAFRLVATESSFRRSAMSEAGAIGYTQILPSTAAWLEPGTEEADLYRRDVNLRLGFRYLRLLLEQNGGNMRLALLAYNRGPATVRSIMASGGDPANGYAVRIMGSE